MRLLSIFVRTGLERDPDAEDRSRTRLARQIPGLVHDTVVVDNALPAGYASRAPGRLVVGGDNRFREFSAWDRGVEAAGPAIWGYDLVHLVTSAFERLYTGYLDRITPPLLQAVRGRAAALGHIDCYNEPIRFGPWVSQHWLRTSYVFLPPAEVRLLGSFVSVADRGRLFSGDPARPFREDAPLSDTYRRYLIDWLTGTDIGQGVQWHSRLALDEATLPEFEAKALAILNEHVLGIRLRAAACRLIDVTWLRTILDRDPDAPVPWATPWRRQLEDRGWDPLRLAPAAPPLAEDAP